MTARSRTTGWDLCGLTEFCEYTAKAIRSYHGAMSMWRCPHCGTPQAETARCWVCHRSSTTCSTCRHFRRSVAAQVGFCGLDRRRLPLNGTEHRGCWEARPSAAPESMVRTGPIAPVPVPPGRDEREHPRDFIPVELGLDRSEWDRDSPTRVTGVADGRPSQAISDLPSLDLRGPRLTLFAELDA